MKKLALLFLLFLNFFIFVPPTFADDARQVQVGAYVNQIRDVDLRSQSFSADIYVWFKWSNPDLAPDSTFEFMNAFDPSSSVLKKSYDKAYKLPSGELLQIIRYQGRFSSNISLRSYPFDKQKLQIIFEDNALSTIDLNYTTRPIDFYVNKDLALPGHDISRPSITIFDQKYPTDFGFSSDNETGAYSRVVISFDITRPFLPYFLKLVFPIFLVVTIAGLAFWITPEEVEARVGMVVTSLLTLVALQITTNSNVPEVEYMMLIDLLYNISFAFVLVVMIDVVISTHLHKSNRDESAIAVGRKVRNSSVVAYLLLIFLSVYVHM